MTNKLDREASYVLRRTIRRHGMNMAAGHQWLYEFDRWKELVFALLSRITQLPETDVREITEDLAELDLLDVATLAQLPVTNTARGARDHLALHILDLLTEGGFSKEEALRGLKILREAAVALNTHFQGKVQRYLRHYGELMLKEMPDLFNFSEIDDAAARYAFTYWLQNVTNMPLSLADENVQRYCKQHKMKLSELIAAADDQDINLAYLDDLALLEVTPPPDAKMPEPLAESRAGK